MPAHAPTPADLQAIAARYPIAALRARARSERPYAIAARAAPPHSFMAPGDCAPVRFRRPDDARSHLGRVHQDDPALCVADLRAVLGLLTPPPDNDDPESDPDA